MRKQKDKYGAKGRFVYTDEQLDLLALSMVLPGARALRYDSDDMDEPESSAKYAQIGAI